MLTPSSPAFLGKGRTPQGVRIYAVGDIHGRADLLQKLLVRVEEDARLSNKERVIFITLGDLVDRGDYSKETIDILLKLPPEWQHISLRGNHEEMLLGFLDNPEENSVWLLNGGLALLQSYGMKIFKPTFNHKELHNISKEFSEKIPSRHLQYLQSQELYYKSEEYLFVHAGLRPRIPLEKQKKDDILWIREEFLNEDYNFGPMIIHGHTVSSVPDICKNRVGIDTGAVFSGKLTCLALQGSEAWFI